MFDNLKIKTQITAILAIMVALLVINGGVALYSSREAVDLMQDVVVSGAQKEALLQKIKLKMEANRTHILLSLQHNPASDLAKLHDHPLDVHGKAIAAAITDIDKLWQQYSATSRSVEEKKMGEEWYAKSGKLGVEPISLANSAIAEQKWDEAGLTLVKKINPTYKAGDVAAKALFDYQEKQNKNSDSVVSSNLANLNYLMIGVILVGGGVALVFGILLARSIYFQMGGEPSYVAKIIRAVAKNDLTIAIDVNPKDDHSLLFDVKNMQANLARTIGSIMHSSDAIANASAEIAAGNMDLSTRTEHQASSLEETASSMEQLTSTVQQNGENARQANSLAQSASEVAKRGGQVVSDVVVTMGSINDSSRKIVDIIGVIDGIAFQTNILALNAAVEAARAGEQGRGFAVVASEVRNLAQRSAAAAKEIKGLIGDSVEKVDAGARLVDQAGSTMAEVVESVRRVSDIIGEIAYASSEQSEGIGQVNNAISQMDEVTQQNAAVVEEVAATAQTLREQAASLAHMVAEFHIGQGVAAPAAAAARPVAPVRRPVAKPLPKPRVVPTVTRSVAASPKPAAQPAAKKAAQADDGWEEF
jgi:methyl-accepting chemotaxis protein